MKYRLVFEDDSNIAELVVINLENNQTKVTCCYDGKEGFIEVYKSDYELIVLNLMLPSKKGMDVCTEFRATKVNTPVLVLTSK
ncbi:response regulator [Mangrovimonas aestuarii]|uniref:response regulator n=1 Tax=Mangrovimonas aestuarii TaxID=3018443 RepID=UPI0023781369|nr:response regulator [Mangrovimonas aestuarii]